MPRLRTFWPPLVDLYPLVESYHLVLKIENSMIVMIARWQIVNDKPTMKRVRLKKKKKEE